MNFKKGFIILILLFFLTGCKGDDIRDFRSIGYSLQTQNFKCDLVKTFKYLGNNFAVGEDGILYSLSIELMYKNKNNCKVADSNNKVQSLYNEEAIKLVNNQIYQLRDSTIFLTNSNEKKQENLFLADDSVLKVIEVNNHYYTLKNDGNVYDYTLNENNTNYSVRSALIFFDKNKYGNILDFNYSDNEDTIFIKTVDGYYRNQITNNECLKYADVECKYELKEDKLLNKYKDEIIGYNGELLILKGGQTMTFSSKRN